MSAGKARHILIAVFLLQSIILLAGCQTTKNIAKGISEGVPQDFRDTCKSVEKADNWFRKNLW